MTEQQQRLVDHQSGDAQQKVAVVPSNPSVRSVTGQEAADRIARPAEAIFKSLSQFYVLDGRLTMFQCEQAARAVLDLFNEGRGGEAPDLIAALASVIDAHDEWTAGMEGLEFDDPLSDAIEQAREAIAKATTAISPASQEGMKLVPVEPSEEIWQLLEKLDGLRAKATKGPWAFLLDPGREVPLAFVMGKGGNAVTDYFNQGQETDAAYIVALENAYDKLRSYILSPSPAKGQSKDGGWRTIESAPKDGTHIWACWPNGYQSETWFDAIQGLWREHEYADDVGPTHWQPLPEPPRQDGENK